MMLNGWVRVYLDDHTSGALIVRAINTIATDKGLPTAWPESKPPQTAVVSGMVAKRSVLVHPDVHDAWLESRPKVTKKAAVKKTAARKKAAGTAKPSGGDQLCRSRA